MRIAVAVAAIVGAVCSTLVHACGDDAHGHDHQHAKRSQPGATQANAWPSAPLVWGDVNFLHTTDTHGWLLGHLKSTDPEPNYSGDLGDFASFIEHMKLQAIERNVDLLLIDSGDLHDGTGLSDGGKPARIDGQDSDQFIKQLPYDVLAIGNHELYEYPIALNMKTDFAPFWGDKYLSSNVNITYADPKTGANKTEPIGARFRKFKTRKGRKVTAFGVLYNFAGQAQNLTVQKVQNMVNETWFVDAIQDEPDFFLLVGHMPVQRDNWPSVFNAIRKVHPTTPIYIFGGHTHIRDCVQMDGRSMSLESGRYMETIGWMSSNLDHKNSSAPLNITRRYLDQNRNTYKYHSKFPIFDTFRGLELSAEIKQLSKKFNISYTFGTAPQDYFLSRVPYPSNQSVLSLFANEVVPTALAIVHPERANVPNIAIANAGSQRFDLLKGPFSRNDQFIVSPFDDEFLYVTVPYSVGSQVLGVLNKQGASGRKRFFSEKDDVKVTRWLGGVEEETPEQYARGVVDGKYNRWLQEMWEREGRDVRGMEKKRADLTLGYVTKDSCPGVGDDTLHTPIPYYGSPAYIGSPLPTGLAADAEFDVVFLDFFESQILSIINGLQSAKKYTSADVQSYGGALTNEVYGIFAQNKWN